MLLIIGRDLGPRRSMLGENPKKRRLPCRVYYPISLLDTISVPGRRQMLLLRQLTSTKPNDTRHKDKVWCAHCQIDGKQFVSGPETAPFWLGSQTGTLSWDRSNCTLVGFALSLSSQRPANFIGLRTGHFWYAYRDSKVVAGPFKAHRFNLVFKFSPVQRSPQVADQTIRIWDAQTGVLSSRPLRDILMGLLLSHSMEMAHR